MADANPIGSALSSLLSPISGAVTDVSKLVPPDFNNLFTQAYNDLGTYYGDLSSQDQTDYNALTSNLQIDEQNAIDYANQDQAQTTQQTTANLTGNLASDALTAAAEQRGLTDTLNQRGMAVTQGADGKLTAQTQGEGGFETSQLNQQQQLRQEALKRTAQQTVDAATLKQQQATTSAKQQLSESDLSASQNLRNQQQSLYQSRVGQAQGMAEIGSGQQLNAQQLALNKQSLQGQVGSGSGVSKTDINPATGKMYGINPSSGVWDDNYFSKTYG